MIVVFLLIWKIYLNHYYLKFIFCYNTTKQTKFLYLMSINIYKTEIIILINKNKSS